MKKTSLFLVIYLFLPIYLFSQDSISKKVSPFSFNTDIVSSYLWRGFQVSDLPQIQPELGFSKGNFEVGCWATQSINGNYSELDLYASYSKGAFTFMLADYYTFTDNPEKSYFSYSKKSTNHSLEGSVLFEGPDKFPLSILLSTYIYGNDRDTMGTNYYSTYVELLYSLKNFDFTIGATPFEGLYADKFAMVNLGIRYNKEMKISENLSLPVYFSIVTNPYSEKFYFAVGITI